MRYEVRQIVNSVASNEKRMAKLAPLTGMARFNKAIGYVVAEAQAQHVRLTQEEGGDAATVIIFHEGR